MLKFLHMGGYAMFVWPSYALTLLVVGLNIGWARRSLRNAQIQARRRLAHTRAAESSAALEPGIASLGRSGGDVSRPAPVRS